MVSNVGIKMSGASMLPQSAGVEPVTVDVEACRNLATVLRSHSIPQDQEDSSLSGFLSSDVANFYLLLVAISHQTSPQGRKALEGTVGGSHRHGWDYLSAKLEAAVRVEPRILSPIVWAQITSDEVRSLFHDELLGDRLSDTEGRAELIRDLGRQMLRHSWKSAEEIYRASDGYIAGAGADLLSLLAEFRAYSDPVRKKSFFFLALMRNAGVWVYKDPSKLGAPIDYHEIRGHLRIGTVQILDPELQTKLIDGRTVTPEQDIAIRQAVQHALMLVSEFSGLRNPSQIHYLFWNVFRSCCTRDNPHCHSCPPSCTLPARYVPLALFPDGTRRCPFSNICQSAAREPKLLEPRTETDYY